MNNMTAECETRIIAIAPDSDITPDHLTRFIHSLELPVTVKETCYGAIVEGDKEVVRKILVEVRKLDPPRIYSKIRGFPAGDTRRCRAHHGSRPGFSQLEKEWRMLTTVSKGLESLERDGEITEPVPEKKLPVAQFKKIIEEVLE